LARPKRTPLEREQDLAKLAQAYLAGKTQAEIAQELNITQQQISYDLGVLQERWVKSALNDIDKAKAQELAKLDNLEREYWVGWVDSKKEYRGTTAERTRGKNFGTKVQIKKEQRLGDPRFLDGVKSCIERRCKILGLEAPTKAQVSFDKMTNDELINFITGKT
jgi:hypothetical protein